jgi:hypothetical protein
MFNLVMVSLFFIKVINFFFKIIMKIFFKLKKIRVVFDRDKKNHYSIIQITLIKINISDLRVLFFIKLKAAAL